MTLFTRGRQGLRDLSAGIRRIRLPAAWYTVLLTPPALILARLFSLKTLSSPVFAPNKFWLGISFGCAAGFFEEIGWTGFAFPEMSAKHSGVAAAIALGLLREFWHLPLVDYLGTATPHSPYWFRFFLAFAAAMPPCAFSFPVRAHQQRSLRSAHARGFNGLARRLQPTARLRRSGNNVVCHLGGRLWLVAAVLAIATRGSFSSPNRTA